MFRAAGLYEKVAIRRVARLATPPTPTAAIIAAEVEKQRKQFLQGAYQFAAVEQIASPAASHALEVYVDSRYIMSLRVVRVGMFILDHITRFDIGFPRLVIRELHHVLEKVSGQVLPSSPDGFCRILDCSCTHRAVGIERICTMCEIAVCEQCVLDHGCMMRLTRGHCMCDVHPGRPLWARRIASHRQRIDTD